MNPYEERRRQRRIRYARARFNYYDKLARSTAHSIRWMDRNGIIEGKEKYMRELEEFTSERTSFAQMLNELENAAPVAT